MRGAEQADQPARSQGRRDQRRRLIHDVLLTGSSDGAAPVRDGEHGGDQHQYGWPFRPPSRG
jgi:hypothetical protein